MGTWNFVIVAEDSDTGGPSVVGAMMEYLFVYQCWYWELWVENLWGGKGSIILLILSCRVLLMSVGEIWYGWFYLPVCSYKFHAFTVYLHSTFTVLQCEVRLEFSRASAMEFFSRNSQRVKVVGYFRRRPPSSIFDRMFDKILNAALPNNLL